MQTDIKKEDTKKDNLPEEWEHDENKSSKPEEEKIDWKVFMEELREQYDPEIYELFHYSLDLGTRRKHFVARSLGQNDLDEVREFVSDKIFEAREKGQAKAEEKAKEKNLDWNDREIQAEMLGRYLPDANLQKEMERIGMCRECIVYPLNFKELWDAGKISPGIVDRGSLVIMEISGYVEPEIEDGNLQPIAKGVDVSEQQWYA